MTTESFTETLLGLLKRNDGKTNQQQQPSPPWTTLTWDCSTTRPTRSRFFVKRCSELRPCSYTRSRAPTHPFSKLIIHQSLHRTLTKTYFSADQWNLRKPLQQCSLRIERRGSILLIVFTFTPEDQRGSKLFAICRVTSPNIIDFVQPVEDSSRYFAVKVSDESQSREAWLGLGFREREEAQDFQQCLFNYQKAMMSQQ